MLVVVCRVLRLLCLMACGLCVLCPVVVRLLLAYLVLVLLRSGALPLVVCAGEVWEGGVSGCVVFACVTCCLSCVCRKVVGNNGSWCMAVLRWWSQLSG